jgi:hypothetical protein
VEKGTLKPGSSSPPSRIPVLMPRKLTIGKISRISIFQRKTGRCIVNWYDEHGARRNAQIRLSALNRDRKTEAELVLRDQTKRKPVETFSPAPHA